LVGDLYGSTAVASAASTAGAGRGGGDEVCWCEAGSTDDG